MEEVVLRALESGGPAAAAAVIAAIFALKLAREAHKGYQGLTLRVAQLETRLDVVTAQRDAAVAERDKLLQKMRAWQDAATKEINELRARVAHLEQVEQIANAEIERLTQALHAKRARG